MTGVTNMALRWLMMAKLYCFICHRKKAAITTIFTSVFYNQMYLVGAQKPWKKN